MSLNPCYELCYMRHGHDYSPDNPACQDCEFAKVVQERDEARKAAALLPDICVFDSCAGDMSVGIPPCPAYQMPDIDVDGKAIGGGCKGVLIREAMHDSSEKEEPNGLEQS